MLRKPICGTCVHRVVELFVREALAFNFIDSSFDFQDVLTIKAWVSLRNAIAYRRFFFLDPHDSQNG